MEGPPHADGGPLYHYCIIRSDLGSGRFAAQLIHAARESSAGLPATLHEHAIALSVPDERHLLHWECRLRDAGIPFTTIREPDAPFHGAATAIGIRPMRRSHALRKLLGRLPLVE